MADISDKESSQPFSMTDDDEAIEKLSRGHPRLQPVPYERETGLGFFEVIIAIFKNVMGVGLFFLPFMYKQTGLYAGPLIMLVIALISIYINKIIMETKYIIFRDRPCTYSDLVREVLGPAWGYSVYATVLVANLGGCAIYLVVSATLLHLMVRQIDYNGFLYILTGGEVLISWLPSLRFLSWASVIGNICLIAAVVAVLVYGFDHGGLLPSTKLYPNWSTLPYSFSIPTFHYIQPSTLFPISNEMRVPSSFAFCCLLAYSAVLVVDLTFTILSFLMFGDATEEIVVKNLCQPQCSSYWFIALIMIVVSVFFAYPYSMVTAFGLVEKSLLGEEKPYWKAMIIRTLSNCIACGLAVAIPGLSNLLNITSGIALTWNGFVIGPLLYVKVRSVEFTTGRIYLVLLAILHGTLMAIGLALGGWATYAGGWGAISYY